MKNKKAKKEIITMPELKKVLDEKGTAGLEVLEDKELVLNNAGDARQAITMGVRLERELLGYK